MERDELMGMVLETNMRQDEIIGILTAAYYPKTWIDARGKESPLVAHYRAKYRLLIANGIWNASTTTSIHNFAS